MADPKTQKEEKKIKDFKSVGGKTAEQKPEKYLDGWKRCLADFDNYKKQQSKTFEDLRTYATEDLIREIIPILDSFDLALKSVPGGGVNKGWKQGIVYIKGQLEDVLKIRGLEKIRVKGEKFNPELHEAIENVESDKESGTVLEEVQRGYKIGEKIIRPARVKVAR